LAGAVVVVVGLGGLGGSATTISRGSPAGPAKADWSVSLPLPVERRAATW
jgi:hypothetical protein